MDVLRPQIIKIGNRCYRKNPSLQNDVTEEEEEFFGSGEFCSLSATLRLIMAADFCFSFLINGS